jgi:hypothetical protein
LAVAVVVVELFLAVIMEGLLLFHQQVVQQMDVAVALA